MFQLYRGEYLPTHQEQWSLAKSMKRQFLVDGNKMEKRMWEFDSSDDEGEDLGEDIKNEDYDEELDGGAAAGGDAAATKTPAATKAAEGEKAKSEAK